MENINIFFKKLSKNYINFFIIFFIWCSLFLSLNTNFVSIFELFEEFSFKNLIKARSILIIISFFLIVSLIFKKKIYFKNNFFYFLLFFILFIQSIYFFSDDFNLINKISISNIYQNHLFADRVYGIQLQAIQLFLSIFISLSLIVMFNEKKNEDVFTITFLFFLGIFCIFYFGLYIIGLPEHLNSADVLLYFNSFFAHEAQLIEGEPAIRVTGLGRSLLIISLILFSLYLSFKKNNKLNFILITLLIFTNISIIYTGSRFATYSLFFTYLFIFIFLGESYLKKIKYFFIFLILPIILFFITANILKDIQLNKKLKSINSKYKNLDLNINYEDLTLEDINKFENNQLKNDLKKIIIEKNLNKGLKAVNNTRYVDQLSNTTGRVQIWKNAIEVIKERESYVFGNGINADRRLLVKYGNRFGTNASNGLINIFLTSGILGLLFFILANLIILIRILDFIFIQKCFSNFKNYYLINLSILIIFVFYQRIVFENSITSFGVDYLIYIVCCYFLLNKIKFYKPI